MAAISPKSQRNQRRDDATGIQAVSNPNSTTAPIVRDAFLAKLIGLLDKYRDLGEVTFPNGTISIGKIPGKQKWFLVHIFGALNAAQIKEIEEYLGRPLPNHLRAFLSRYNGLCLFGAGQIELWGHIGPARQDMPNYQPISIVNANNDLAGRVSNLPIGALFIGGYFGRYLFYVVSDSQSVFACREHDGTPIEEWDSIESMILDLARRMSPWFDKDAQPVDPAVNNRPVLFEKPS